MSDAAAKQSFRHRLLLMGLGGFVGVFIALAGFGLTKNNPSSIVVSLGLPGRILSQVAGSVGITSGPLVMVSFLAGQFVGYAVLTGVVVTAFDFMKRSRKQS